MYLTLKFTLKNVGNQPAFNVRPHYKICLNNFSSNLSDQQQELREFIKRKNQFFPEGFTIFPGDSEKTFLLNCNLSKSEIDSDYKRQLDQRNGIELENPHLINVIVIGLIDYKSTLDSNRHHQTGFAFYLSARQVETARGTTMTLCGNLLPVQKEPFLVENLILSPFLTQYNFFFAD
jgi:hypothetical protein